jgi:glycerol-3-phosphate acyltransferase PlsY
LESRTFFLYSLALVQAYLLGAIPFGFLLARYVKGIDVRTAGSGNIGATNVGRVAGAPLGVLAFLLDVAKGLAAATVIPWALFIIAGGYRAEGTGDVLRMIFTGRQFTDLRIVCGLAAIAGHVWTVFLRFRGGKGVATSLGVMLGLAPWPTLAAFSLWVVVTGVSGYVSLGSITAAAAMPVALAWLEWKDMAGQWRLVAFVAVVSGIVVWRHRGNIKRLLAGTEHRFRGRRGDRGA